MKAFNLHRKSDTLIIKDFHKRAYLAPDDRGIGKTSRIWHRDGWVIGKRAGFGTATAEGSGKRAGFATAAAA
ncbi:hypothetical protein BHU16_04695 [Tannerella sp. oral taxon 808]|nr:hypothetical protein BHU16_04695 [Tannerella sp. oral taxon 808]